MWNSIKRLIEILLYYISGVKCIVGQHAFKPSVNLSSDYEIVSHDSQQSYLKWE